MDSESIDIIRNYINKHYHLKNVYPIKAINEKFRLPISYHIMDKSNNVCNQYVLFNQLNKMFSVDDIILKNIFLELAHKEIEKALKRENI